MHRHYWRWPWQIVYVQTTGRIREDANGNYFMKVSGIAINDHFQVVSEDGLNNERIYVMAVPYIGGYNPDYSGLDFCEAASKCIIEALVAS